MKKIVSDFNAQVRLRLRTTNLMVRREKRVCGGLFRLNCKALGSHGKARSNTVTRSRENKKTSHYASKDQVIQALV